MWEQSIYCCTIDLMISHRALVFSRPVSWHSSSVRKHLKGQALAPLSESRQLRLAECDRTDTSWRCLHKAWPRMIDYPLSPLANQSLNWAWVSYRSLSLTMKDLASALASPLAMNGCILVQTMLWVGLCFPDWWLWLVEQPPGDRYWLDLTVLLTGSIRCQRGQLQRAGGIVQVCRNPICVTGATSVSQPK